MYTAVINYIQTGVAVHHYTAIDALSRWIHHQIPNANTLQSTCFALKSGWGLNSSFEESGSQKWKPKSQLEGLAIIEEKKEKGVSEFWALKQGPVGKKDTIRY